MNSRSKKPVGLEAELAEKDELIQALTGQLELAVERLDRLRRAGADRQVNAVSDSPALPANNELGQRLSGMLDQWSEYRPFEHIDRIEEGLAKLLEMVAARPLINVPINVPTSVEPQQEESSWAQIKSQMMQADQAASKTGESAVSDVPHSFTPLKAADEEVPPEPVPVDADVSMLFNAVDERDRYIRYLADRLHQTERAKFFPSWDQLQHAPAEMLERLKQLEHLLQEQLRRNEITHSLERAGLTREKAKLNQVKQNLELQIRRLGHSSTPHRSEGDSNASQATEPTRPDLESRWKRLFRT